MVSRWSKQWFHSSRRLQQRRLRSLGREDNHIIAGGLLATCSLVALTQFTPLPGFESNIANATTQRNVTLTGLSYSGSLFSSAARCDDDGLLYAEKDFPDGYTETERFLDVLDYHRSLLPDYMNRWMRRPSKKEWVSWPRHIPSEDEIGSLELDHKFCRRSPNYRGTTVTCQDLQFRIASYFLSKDDSESKRKGFQMIKDLAEHGHADGMCYYGILLNQGSVEGVEANPKQAVVWWRRCVDYHRHIWASFEMGVALYTGEGVAENPYLASKYFRQAAHLGHAAAAYLLGDQLLNGVGVERDRASALEWLVTAAELGHPLARKKVILLIQQDYEALQRGDSESKNEGDSETLKWADNPDKKGAKNVLVERRYTIGGGSGNPEVLRRRKTIVKESRDEDVSEEHI